MHASLVDVLIGFRLYRITLVADISKMYQAIELHPHDCDLHNFVWRNEPNEDLQDFHMTRVTFGVSASSFVPNMAVKQNAMDHMHEFPLAAKVFEQAFYMT